MRAQEALMDTGLKIGQQIIEQVQEVRDLYEDEEEDDEEIAAMTEAERSEYEANVRSATI